MPLIRGVFLKNIIMKAKTKATQDQMTHVSALK